MNGPELLRHAAGVVDKRRGEYGEPEHLFANIAERWSQVLGVDVTPVQVALCLADLKMARLAHNPKHLDSLIDVAGYVACAHEV